MLICKNCSTIQETGVDRCVHCNIPGQLVPYRSIAERPQPKAEAPDPCTNCGCTDPGHDAKCIECNFPLPAGRREGEGKEREGNRYSLRAG